MARTVLMVIAMMSPLMVANVRHVAFSSPWSRRHRSSGLFLLGYVGAWVIATLVLGTAIGILAAAIGQLGAMIATVGATAGWQLSATKRRALRRCALTVPIAPSGWRADWGCLRFGVLASASCIVTCCGFMAVATAAGHGLPALVGLFGLQLRERVVVEYRAGVAAGLVALVGSAVIGVSIAGGA